MNFEWIHMLQGVLLLSIVFLAFKTITLALEARTSKKFILKGMLQNEQQARKEVDQTNFFDRITSFGKYKNHLEHQLKEAKMTISVGKFIFQRIAISGSIFLLMITLYFVSGKNVLFLYLSLPLTILAYMLPKRTLKKSKQYYIFQMKQELPDYLFHFAVLLKSYTSFEATKKSEEYAGPLLKPYVQRLITQIELSPASKEPYHAFAEAIELREAREFVVALEQIMKVDAASADKMIEDQIHIMGELQEEAYNEQIEARPDEVERYINPMLFPFIGIIMTFLFVLIADSLSNI